jgi:hypothetical protein
MTAPARRKSRRVRRTGQVSATELAEMGFCEKRILLARFHGELTTAPERERIRRGHLAHQRYYEQGLAAASYDRRCFIATCVFGESASQTHVLRKFRDAVLLRSYSGRGLVTVYYMVAPTLCVALRRSTFLLKVTRMLLEAVVAHLQRVAAAAGED